MISFSISDIIKKLNTWATNLHCYPAVALYAQVNLKALNRRPGHVQVVQPVVISLISRIDSAQRRPASRIRSHCQPGWPIIYSQKSWYRQTYTPPHRRPFAGECRRTLRCGGAAAVGPAWAAPCCASDRPSLDDRDSGGRMSRWRGNDNTVTDRDLHSEFKLNQSMMPI